MFLRASLPRWVGPAAQTTRFGDGGSVSVAVKILFRLRSIGIIGKKREAGGQAGWVYVGCEDAMRLELEWPRALLAECQAPIGTSQPPGLPVNVDSIHLVLLASDFLANQLVGGW